MRHHRSDIDTAGLQDFLDSASNAADLGKRQYFTPASHAAAFASMLPACRHAVVDFTAGDGSLLAGSAINDSTHRLAIEIDPSVASVGAIVGDITRIFPLMVDIDWRADCFVLNPPFSLAWHTKNLHALSDSGVEAVRQVWQGVRRKPTIDSTLATLLIALDRLTSRGEGMLICNADTADRLFGSGIAADLARHIWLDVRTPSYFPNVGADIRFACIYFAREEQSTPATRIELEDASAESIAAALATYRTNAYARDGFRVTSQHYAAADTTINRWRTLREETRRTAESTPSSWNIWLSPQGFIQRHLTPFQKLSRKIPTDLVQRLDSLHGQAPMALVVQRATRDALVEAISGDIWRVHPDVLTSVKAALAAYGANRAPFYPLNAVQRLGYLDEQDIITCTSPLASPTGSQFEAGGQYAISSRSIDTLTSTSRPNLAGKLQVIEMHGKDLLIEITDARGIVQGFVPDPQSVPDRAHLLPLQSLVDTFEIPEVPDIATLQPERYQRHMATLATFEASLPVTPDGRFTYRIYQREDLCRFCLHDGGIFAWDKGLGKTSAAATIPTLHGSRRNLLIAPEGLYVQTIEEFSVKFGITLIPLPDQAAFRAHPELQTPYWELPATDTPAPYYITSYTAIGQNGADEWPDAVHGTTGETIKNLTREASRAALITGILGTGSAPLDPYTIARFTESVGEEITHTLPDGDTHTIRCIFTPTLARLCADAFECVIIDEGVRLKSDDSLMSMGIRQLRPAYRAVLTGTPVKNILDDIFWLAHWAAGGHELATARWPYENHPEARQRFAAEHLITEHNITREKEETERTGRRRSFTKRTATICNIHHLWKLLGPIVLRRRKDNCGESIVPKTITPVRVRPGTAQQAVYSRYLHHRPIYRKRTAKAHRETLEDFTPINPMAAVISQYQLLREAALSPDSPALADAVLGHDAKGPATSYTTFNPKHAACLTLVREMLERGEQCVILAPFQHFGKTITARLKSAGISVCNLDGNLSPRKRGEEAARFKRREYAVLVGTITSMSEGHNFAQCPNLILPSLSWAFDENDQAIDRVHRLTSLQPVSIYILITENTIDELLYQRFVEKSDSSSLAIDAHLITNPVQDINLADLLREAMATFDPNSETLDESAMDDEWVRTLRNRMARAFEVWREWQPPVVPEASGALSITQADIDSEKLLMLAAVTEVEATQPTPSPLLLKPSSRPDSLAAALAALDRI